ncbi:MAG: FecR domain-containing protein [Chitinophagaceae bacterium]|nr:FecR domain-containing protein [Chitinophagaceae bacterium]
MIKHLDAGLDAAEQQELNTWMSQSKINKEAIQEFLDDKSLQKGIGDLYKTKERIWQKLEQTVDERKIVSIKRKIWQWAVAAAIITGITVSGYFIFPDNSKHDNANTQANTEHLQNNIKPGSYKAKLVLADGTEIVLDSATLGKLAQQGNAAVVNQDGKLVYIPGAAGDEEVYNTVMTARGETYSLVLADKSKVWLNAASSIKFPASFIGNERRVEITGEAYFEVAKDAEKRFIVSAKGITTEVFGTHFNINTYNNEFATRVTLLEGNIQVNKNNVQSGQQAVVNDNGHLEITSNIDLEQVVAWKNGEFQFGDKTDIKTAMRQVERWYDIDVEYRGTFNSHIGGSISRTASLPKILKMLEKTGVVKFEIQDKRIIVISGQ